MSGYDDIINLPHHVSKTRPRMPAIDRAAQFSPFAALTGYDDWVKETARLTDFETELSEDTAEAINRQLTILLDRLDEQPQFSVTYFKPDKKKRGGAYLTITGTAKKIDLYNHCIIMNDGTTVPFESIYGVEITEKQS